jgi:AraC-like DNA-binding protein
MLFNFGSKSSLLLVFFIHGLVFSILLLIKGIQNNDKPSYWLSFFTILCTLYISPFMLGYAGWYSRNPYRDILFYIPFQQLFLLPPVLYFYCKTLFDKSYIFQTKDFAHFIPAFIYLLYSIVVFFTDKIVLDEYYFYQDGRDKDFAFEYQAVGFVSLVFYSIRCLNIYQNYKLMTYNTVSYADSLTFKWAQRFLLAFLLLLVIRGLFFIINPEWDAFGRKFWYYLLFSILFYYISISGFINSVRSVVSLNTLPIPTKNHLDLSISSEIIDFSTNTNEEKLLAGKSEIPDLEIWKSKIEKLMLIDKIYENPELSIYHLAQQLATHPKKISQVINQGFAMNFNDYINQHRVKAVIQKMAAGEHSLQTLLGLAFDCGFNSKSTFNRAFKRLTSLSPNEYIKKNFT